MVGTIARSLLIVVVVSAVALVASPSPSRAQLWPATCGYYGPFGFDTYEALNHVADYGRAINYAVEGKAVPEPYNIWTGERIDVSYQGVEKGPRNNRSGPLKTERIPPSVYKSIAWIEANWNNAAGSVPYGGVGQVLTSFDCGYGLGQVTTGMANTNGNASAHQAIVGTHFLFNVAEGVRILADKWNSAPRYRPIAGLGNPAHLEDWYYAIWSYNGFAFSNHPLNPERSIWRGEVYHCYDPSSPNYIVDGDGDVVFGYGAYTYPERVYGCMRYPPKRDDVRMYGATTFSMPNFSIPAVAQAFDPEAFKSCQAIGFSTGCPDMDYPTTIPAYNVVPHADPTPKVSGTVPFLGAPSLAFSGKTNVSITVSNSGSIFGTETVTLSNAGTYIAPFRIRTSADWIVVHHPGESSRRLQGSIAIGNDVSVVTSVGTQAGYKSTLIITVDQAKMPASHVEGTVWIEALYGAGRVFKINVAATRGAYSLPIRAVVPAISADKD